jgi:predicted RecB family endonuclease
VDGIHYDYFGFVTTYTREGDDARMKMARQLGYEVESQWKYPPVRLSSDYYEYYVDAPGDAKIPEKLHRQLSALLGFYSANEERFKIEYLNSLTLQATRKADLKSNPPKEAEEIIVNYTPLRGEDAE